MLKPMKATQAREITRDYREPVFRTYRAAFSEIANSADNGFNSAHLNFSNRRAFEAANRQLRKLGYRVFVGTGLDLTVEW